ncbi:MAG: hypothetical protein R2911_16800 [Caldilineaceae bacterium]
MRGPAFIISTIALLLTVRIVFDNWDLVGGSGGVTMPLINLPVNLVKVPFYYGMLITAMAAVYTSYRIKHSKFGLGLRAISQDEIKAEAAASPPPFTRFWPMPSAPFCRHGGQLLGPISNLHPPQHLHGRTHRGQPGAHVDSGRQRHAVGSHCGAPSCSSASTNS